jgi:hypothetical protein
MDLPPQRITRVLGNARWDCRLREAACRVDLARIVLEERT